MRAVIHREKKSLNENKRCSEKIFSHENVMYSQNEQSGLVIKRRPYLRKFKLNVIHILVEKEERCDVIRTDKHVTSRCVFFFLS